MGRRTVRSEAGQMVRKRTDHGCNEAVALAHDLTVQMTGLPRLYGIEPFARKNADLGIVGEGDLAALGGGILVSDVPHGSSEGHSGQATEIARDRGG